MKKSTQLLSLILALIHFFTIQCIDALHASWTVVGAGPTGIKAVGLILDSGVPANQIVWLDREFNVGRMGKHYKNVPVNGRVSQYIAFLNECKIFREINSDALNYLCNLPLDYAPDLKVIVDPLFDITKYLIKKVHVIKDEMVALDFHHDKWTIKTHKTKFSSDNVVLATGAHPRTLSYEGVPQIPLDIALDKNTLAACINEEDTVAVIGSGHSSILILKYLSELPVAQVINFYNKPVVYPVPMRGGIAWKETGLKGAAAEWAKTVLEVNPPENLLRLESTPELIEELLPQCTKIIYAVGFERNELPIINGDRNLYENYDRSSGIISHRLYGVGIAFPQQQTDPLGNTENLVGLPYLTFDALKEALEDK